MPSFSLEYCRGIIIHHKQRESLIYKNCVTFDSSTQALTNQLLSNVRSRTPVLQYLFVYVLPYQNICTH